MNIGFEIIFYYESFINIYTSSTFHLYDSQLIEKLNNFWTSWHESLAYGNYYRPETVSLAFGVNKSPEEFEILEKLEKYIMDLGKARKDLLYYIKTYFHEVNLYETSNNALTQYNIQK